MKKEKHPPFQKILFVDANNDSKFVLGVPVGGMVESAVATGKKETYEGEEYITLSMPVTSASHPAFRKEGEEVVVSSRITDFRNKYKKNRVARQQQQKSSEEHFSSLKEKSKKSKKKR